MPAVKGNDLCVSFARIVMEMDFTHYVFRNNFPENDEDTHGPEDL